VAAWTLAWSPRSSVTMEEAYTLSWGGRRLSLFALDARLVVRTLPLKRVNAKQRE
jgi:hypothetical protein